MKIHWLTSLSLALALGGVVACEDEPEEEPTLPRDAFVPPIDNDGGEGGAGGGAGGAGGGGGEGGAGGGERLRLSYVKSVTLEGQTQVDLVVYDFEDDEEFNLTAATGGEVDCRLRTCVLNAPLTWVAWLSQGAAGGFDLWVAPVDAARREIRIGDKRQVADRVNQFAFTGDQLVYSQGQAVGAAGTIDVWVQPAAGFDEAACEADATPLVCPQFLGQINADGGFRSTAFADLVVLIRTTLSSMDVGFFNLRTGATQTLYTFGEAGGTGSEFTGNLPIGLSRDGTWMSIFTRDGFIWRANSLDAAPGARPTSKDLFEVSTAQQGSCGRPMPYNFTEVRFNPVFNSDSSAVYYLARGDCSKRPTAEDRTNRDDFEIFKLPRDLSGDPVSVTNTPRVSNWINQDINDFTISPDDAYLAFVSSRPDNATSRSIWLLDLSAESEEKPYVCGRGMARAGLDGRSRCEFVFDETRGAQVGYRELRFHR